MSAVQPPGNADARTWPWRTALAAAESSTRSICNICGWHGEQFASGYHSEGALCPHCGSIARDRFLYWCWTHRTNYDKTARVLETSPRLDSRYRAMMAQHVSYVCSDFDQSAHRGQIKLDLQNAAVPDNSFDVVLTPHVLEHVPDTTKAVAELHRMLAPTGVMYLQIPMPQGVTAPPSSPEYHGDNTLVFWRFGWDIRTILENAGFEVACLVPADLANRLTSGHIDSGYQGQDIDEVDLLRHANVNDLTVVVDAEDASTYGFVPDFMFIVWEARKRSVSAA